MKKSLLCFFAFLAALTTGCDKNDSPEQVALQQCWIEQIGLGHTAEFNAAVSPGGVLYNGQVCKIGSAERFGELFPTSVMPPVDFQKEVLLLAAVGYRNYHPIITPSVYRNSDGSLVLYIKMEDRANFAPTSSLWLVAVSIDKSLADVPVELQVEWFEYTGD